MSYRQDYFGGFSTASTVSARELAEGEPVYAFGYPLSNATLLVANEQMIMGHAGHSPRTTSAIIASTLETAQFTTTGAEPKVYVLDKALNYGNSGGPIIANETGHVHALCTRFQPLRIPQAHLKNAEGRPIYIEIPSLYGIVSSLNDPRALHELARRGIAIADD